MDPGQFDVLQGGINQHYDRRPAQQAQNARFPTYSQSFGGTPQQIFSFVNPQVPQINPSFATNLFYPGSSNDTTRNQSSQSFPVYGRPTAATQQTPSNVNFYGGDDSRLQYPSLSSDVRISQQPRAALESNINPSGRSLPRFDRNGGSQSIFTPAFDPAFASLDAQREDVALFSAGRASTSEQLTGMHVAKRPRGDDGDGDGGVENDGDGLSDNGVQGKTEGSKTKPPGACARCKGLKVRCEFKTDPDTCKRCLNGGHECIIPGRKKRRAPPKRELLLGQIREQAAKIETLIQQLEEANRRANQVASNQANAPSPTHSNTTTDLPHRHARGTSEYITKPDVLNWIAKAKESIEAFGGYINMGGPGVTKEMLGGDSIGIDDVSDPDETEYEISVENVDGEVSEADGAGRDEGVESERAMSGDEDIGTGSGWTRSHTSRGSSGTQKLASLPCEATPIGLMANLSLKKNRRRHSSRSRSEASADEQDEPVGLANDDYFRPSPNAEHPISYAKHQTPYILRNGLVSPADVEQLFKIYFDYMNCSLSLLDPVLYTAQKTYWRSPFLFTVICAIASRHYASRPELHPQAMNCARLAAGTALIGGQKSVEVVQAYILLSLYPVPARNWEDDRCWIYLGLAIRMATDLNLHHPNTAQFENELYAREMLNRTRTWLNCFNVDRSMASQYGKAPVINNLDYIANHSEFWWNSSPYNIPGFDVHLCAYNAELKVIADYRSRIFNDPNHPVGLNKSLDIAQLASEVDDTLARLWETWSARIRETKIDTPHSRFRMGLLKLAYSYARMTVLSFAFQQSFGKTSSSEMGQAFLWRCLRAATDVATAALHDVGIPSQRIFMSHGPEAQSVFMTFACAFLIKLLSPKFASYLSREKRLEIRNLVEQVSDLLGSPEVAVDDRHGPKLYSRFLKGLLSTPLARIDHSPGAVKRVPKSNSASRPPSRSDNVPETASARQSLSPPPARPSPQSLPASLSPPPADPLAHIPMGMARSFPSHIGLPDDNVSNIDFGASEFYSPPLPFDAELLQSMQSLTGSGWPDMVIPGFSWMENLQPDADVQMRFDPSVGINSSS
ncbi:Protein priB [Grifola frondosa]|uniref:Protein priB n=1 Tax=Grifola frondosa TaxID=5627 RepID=A0A1C7M5N7_GRIFR|nr:Protein priB [Grifola frondosa]